MKGALVDMLRCRQGPGFECGYFGGGFCCCCCVRLLIDGHGRVMDSVMRGKQGCQAEENEEGNAKEGRAEMVGAAAVVGWAVPLHRPAVPASAEEPVEGSCCLPVVFLLQIYLSAFK